MTVTTTGVRETKVGDGATVSWSFTFVALDADHVKVKIRDAVTGTITPLVKDTDFTVALTGTARPAAGSITLIGAYASTKPDSNDRIEIYRVTPRTQTTPLDPRSGFASANPEAIFDKYILCMQEALDALDNRVLRLADGDSPSALATIPNAIDRAGLLLGFDASGDPEAAVEASAVSAAMAPVIAAASLSAARTAMGLGALATGADAGDVPFTPAGSIAATDVQAALEELDTEKQPLDADLTAIAALARVRGDLLYADSTPAWNRKAIGAAGKALISDGADFDWQTPPFGLQNPLINGEFRIWQRGTSLSGIADDAYTADRWYLLTQTGTIADARQSDPFDGARNSARMTQSQASAQRIGRAQIIEGKNCKHLRGQAVTFFGRFKISADQNVRVAILEWTGTEDSVTSDVVNDWTSGTYTAGNFFLGSNLTVSAVKQYASPGTGWVDFFVNATLGSSFNNLIVLIWTEGTAAQNVTFEHANMGLVRGSIPPAAYTPRSLEQEITLCERYYEKSFALDTAPAQSAGAQTSEEIKDCPVAGAQAIYWWIPFRTRKRTSPTVTTYNPASANAQVRNAIDGADCSSTSVDHARERAFLIATTTNAGAGVGEILSVHWSATAEL